MIRRWLIALLLALVCVGVLICLVTAPRITVASFLVEFEADLPPGTPRADVEAWLRERGIGFWVLSGGGTPVGLCGEIEGVYWLEVFPTEIRFQVQFDRDGKLTDVSAYQFTYAL
jgi:hypothetical protein